MENLEHVVKERNRAYYELEVGITGKIRRQMYLGKIFLIFVGPSYVFFKGRVQVGLFSGGGGSRSYL